MFENPRRGSQARNFTTNAPKILDLKSSSEQIFSRKLPLGAPGLCCCILRQRKKKTEQQKQTTDTYDQRACLELFLQDDLSIAKSF